MPCQAEYDHDEWGEPIDVQVGPRIGMAFHVIIHSEELARLDDMMTERGERLMTTFLRDLALEALERWEAEREQAGAVTAAD